MKKLIIAMIAILLVIACTLGVVACDNKEEVDTTNPLTNFNHEIKRHYDDNFELPASIGNYALEWESDNAAITLTKRDDNWLATVNPPEEGTVKVKLTAKSNGHEKVYETSVSAIEVSDFTVAYGFKQNKGTITEDFALDQEFTYKGKKATIKWSVEDEASKEYISISEDNTTCLVTPSTLKPEVKIKATFKYNNEESSKVYTMTVYVKMEGLQLVDYWYNNTGVSIDMSGYVVEIGTPYDEKYKNVTLYMVNDELTAGYYLFRVKTDADNAALLQPGVHITVTGTTNTNYGGLIETNAGGNLVVDTDIDPIDLTQTVKPIDDLLIGNLPALVYNESRLVSLSNWKVKSVCDEVKAGDNFTLLTLTKAGVDIELRVSKYLEGAYKPAEDNEVWKGICELKNTYGVDSVINVTGIFSCYKNAWQIMPLNASAVTAGTADAEGTVYAGKTVADAVSAVNAVLEKEGANAVINADKDITLPATNGEVSISYALCGFSRAVTVEGNTIKVKVGKADSATIQITYKLGDFETVDFISIVSSNETGSEPVQAIVKAEAPFEEGKEYYLVIDQTNANKQLYAASEINKNHYGVTTTELATAEKVYVEKDGENYRLYFNDGTTKTYISWVVNGKYANYIMETVAENAKTWIWDAENNCFKTSEEISPEGKDTGYYFIGTSGNYETVSLNYIGKISESFAAYLGVVGNSQGGDEPEPPKPVEPTVEHAGTEADSYSVADVLAILETLEKGATYAKDGNDTFYIKGYVITGTYNAQYGNYDDFTIGDTAEATTTVVCFRPKMGELVVQAEVGHQIVLKGKIQWYQSSSSDTNSKQVAQGALIVKNLSVVETDDEIADKELNAVADITATISASREIELPTAKYPQTVFTWESDNEAVQVVEAENKLVVTVGADAVSVNVTLTITVNEATRTKVYTLTLDPAQASSTLATFTFGENSGTAHVDGKENTAYTETVNGYTLTLTDSVKVYAGAYVMDGNSALKLGTGSAAGSFKFTVGDDVNKVIIRITGYKAKVAKVQVNDTPYETAQNAGTATDYTAEYMEIVVDTSVNKEVSFTTLNGGYRVMIDYIQFCA